MTRVQSGKTAASSDQGHDGIDKTQGQQRGQHREDEIDEIASYLEAGAAFVGVGRELIDTRALCSGDKDAIIDAAANVLEQAASVRAPPRDRKP